MGAVILVLAISGAIWAYTAGAIPVINPAATASDVAIAVPSAGPTDMPVEPSIIPATATDISVLTVTPLPVSPTPIHPEALVATSQLQVGQELLSVNGRYSFKCQPDGDLVVYDNTTGKPLWSSNTKGSQADYLVMQSDGNLVLYTKAGSPVWASDTNATEGDYYLVMQDDGNLVIYSGTLYAANAVPLWATNTP